MRIREMLEREKYIDDTINMFAKRTRCIEVQIDGWDYPSINISVNDARQIAKCLEWLHEIFKQSIDNLSGMICLPDDY